MSIQRIDEGNKEEPTMIRSRKNAGFTLIELMIVVAIIAIIASIAIPKLMSARLAANEAAAIATLRSVSSAQAQIQSSGAIDTDADGAGEYGYFAELAGSVPMRVSDNAVPGPAAGQAGVAGIDNLSPAILPSAFGNVICQKSLVNSTSMFPFIHARNSSPVFKSRSAAKSLSMALSTAPPVYLAVKLLIKSHRAMATFRANRSTPNIWRPRR